MADAKSAPDGGSTPDRASTPDATDPQSVATVAPGTVPRALGSLGEGDAIGDYRVRHLLGAGGMGEVYLARDDRLQRDVAIKVVRPGIARERLLHEAQAMARLAHPNVIAVYEAGLVGEQVFIAMEYVAGTTLRGWLADPRPWREVVDHFVAAGRGLAAAHHAGLVHRDFKPDNVLLGDDGRARVGDFGLAAPGDRGVGVVEGTPRYMAPEQRRGEAVDGRTDQYAFCVSLWEALAGAPPPEATRGFPSRLRAIVQRGLRPDPDQRFPSMNALLDQLLRDPAVRRRRIAAAGALVALGAVAMVGWSRSSHGPAPCRGMERRLAGVWDRSIAAAVRARFVASHVPYAADTAQRVARALDGYATSWVSMREEACQATAVRHEQSERILDRRVACLDRDAGALGALASQFATRADAAVVERAVSTVGDLPAIADCANSAVLAEIPPPPPGQAAAVAALERRIDAVRADLHARRERGDVAEAEAIVGEARTLGYAPLHADALDALGLARRMAGDPTGAATAFREALPIAAGAHDDHRTVELWRGLIAVALDGGHPDAAVALRDFALAALVRAGDPPALRVRTLDTLSVASSRNGDFAAAEGQLREALALVGDGDPGMRAKLLNGLAVAVGGQGHRAEALAQLREAVTLAQAALGPEHPSVGGALMNLGNRERSLGDLAAAERDLRRALAIFEGSLAPDRPEIGQALSNLGRLLVAEQRIDEAQPVFEKALANREKALGPTHPDVALTLDELGTLAHLRGDDKTALGYVERALAIQTATLGASHPDLFATLSNQGDMLLGLGRYDEARVAYRRAREIRRDQPAAAAELDLQLAQLELTAGHRDEAIRLVHTALDEAPADADGAGDSGLVSSYIAIGGHLADAKRYADAVALLERAVAILGDDRGAAIDIGSARFFLAAALWEIGRERPRAVELARSADQALARAPDAPDIRDHRAAIARWLAHHH